MMRRFGAVSGGGGGGGGYAAETTTWESRIIALGGSVTTVEKDLADALIKAIQAASYGAKIVYLLPFIGASIAAHRVPLRDSLDVGAATSTGFTDADCDTATGLDNSAEANKWLDTKIKASQLGTSSNGGLGWYERAWGAGSNVEPMGSYNSDASQRFNLDLRTSFQRFRWGATTGSQAGPATSASSAHYYGQRSSSTLRRIYKDGVSLGSDGTANDGTDSAGYQNIIVHGCNNQVSPTPWKGRGACAYMTDGTLSDADVADFHTLLGTYLITPTGR